MTTRFKIAVFPPVVVAVLAVGWVAVLALNARPPSAAEVEYTQWHTLPLGGR